MHAQENVIDWISTCDPIEHFEYRCNIACSQILLSINSMKALMPADQHALLDIVKSPAKSMGVYAIDDIAEGKLAFPPFTLQVAFRSCIDPPSGGIPLEFTLRDSVGVPHRAFIFPRVVHPVSRVQGDERRGAVGKSGTQGFVPHYWLIASTTENARVNAIKKFMSVKVCVQFNGTKDLLQEVKIPYIVNNKKIEKGERMLLKKPKEPASTTKAKAHAPPAGQVPKKARAA